MLRPILIAIEGVLAERRDAPLPECPPLGTGIFLYHALKTQFEPIVFSEKYEIEHIAYWCKREGLDAGTNFARGFVRNVIDVQRGKHIEPMFAIVGDPGTALDAMRKGVPTLLSTLPAYPREEWVPGVEKGVTPWDELVRETEHRRLTKLGDDRLSLADATQVARMYEETEVHDA